MITYSTATGSDKWELTGKTTDVKPTENIPNGSSFYEMDGEHNVYMFDAENKEWLLQ